ncbi:cytochrome P450, partial [Exidia glandulosa HHB12029]
AQITLFPRPRVSYVIADAVTIKDITTRRTVFQKPVELLALLKTYGDPNIVIAEGDVHKAHRKAVAPAFSERNMALVWDEATRVSHELFETKEWRGRQTVSIGNFADITTLMTMFIIASAGFGHAMSWTSESAPPPGHSMTFREALAISAHSTLTKLLVPSYAVPFRKKWRTVSKAYDELRQYVFEMIHARRALETRPDRFDLFAGLLDAADADSEKMRLSDEDIVSNAFMFLVAGHETTAHALAFLFGELAINPEEQERLYEDCKANVPSDRPLVRPMMLIKVRRVFHETLRLYPVSLNIPKKCVADTVVPTSSGKSIPIPAGSMIDMSFPGTLRNPKYWSNPNDFVPGRFLEQDVAAGTRDGTAFIPFSLGARSCIGRRFSETEAVAFIVAFVTKYRVNLPDTPEWRGLDKEATREKLFSAEFVLTLAPKRLPLVFTRRN